MRDLVGPTAIGLLLAACLAADGGWLAPRSAHAQARADETRQEKIRIQIEPSTWLAEGQTRWSHNASGVNPSLGNPTSRLTYKDVVTTVAQIRGRVTFANGLFVTADYGYGTIGGGRLTDDDFLAGQVRCCSTHSDLPGDDLWYVNGAVGGEVLTFFDRRGSLKVFGGFQYWRETLITTGVTQVVCTSPGVLCNPAGTVSNIGQPAVTNQASWSSLRVGVESGLQVLSRLRLDAAAAFIPYTFLDNKDIHHLRTDLQQSPSFSMRGTGIGANVEGTVSLMLMEGLYLTSGYRFWWVQITDGTWTNHPVSGRSSSVPLTEFRTMRQGATVGLAFTF
ncbi:hypothetical protein [Nitrospira sp. Kam-Ns4a]